MSGFRRTTARLRRLPLLVWAGALVVVLIGLTAALGGFAPALDHGRPVAAGERITLQRRHLQIDDAVLVDDNYEGENPDPRIWLTVQVEFLGQESTCCMSDGLIEVRYAGAVADHASGVYGELRSPTLDFDPDVPTTRMLEFSVSDVAVPTPAPETVEVVVRDERPGTVLWPIWSAGSAVATVELPVTDLRGRR